MVTHPPLLKHRSYRDFKRRRPAARVQAGRGRSQRGPGARDSGGGDSGGAGGVQGGAGYVGVTYCTLGVVWAACVSAAIMGAVCGGCWHAMARA